MQEQPDVPLREDAAPWSATLRYAADLLGPVRLAGANELLVLELLTLRSSWAGRVRR